MTDAAHPVAHRTQMKRATCHVPTGDALNEYRRIREQLRAERSRRKQMELCASMDRLWRRMTDQDIRKLLAEFMEHERGRR